MLVLTVGSAEPLEQPDRVLLLRIQAHDERLGLRFGVCEFVGVAMQRVEQRGTSAGLRHEPHHQSRSTGQQVLEGVAHDR